MRSLLLPTPQLHLDQLEDLVLEPTGHGVQLVPVGWNAALEDGSDLSKCCDRWFHGRVLS